MADDVNVIVVGQPIRGCSVAKVRVGEQAELLEQLQRSVDSGQVDLGYRIGNLIRGGVHELGHGSHNALTLRCHPHPAFTQPIGERWRLGMDVVGHDAVHGRSLAGMS